MNSILKKGISGLLIAVMLLQVSPMTPAFGATVNPEILVPGFSPLPLSTAKPTQLLGSTKGAESLSNATYYDVPKSTFAREISKMSALGVIRRYGATNYKPETAITAKDAVAMLVRATGGENAVQTRVNAGSTGLSAAALKTLYDTEYAREAQTKAIVPAAEQPMLLQGVNKERLAVWAARAVGLQPNFNELTGIYSFKDAQDVSPQYRNLIESMIDQKFIYLPNDQKFRPKSTMTRGEFASMLERMSDLMLTNLGQTSNFGLVIGKKAETVSLSGAKVTKTTFTVKGVDGTLTEIVAQYNPKTKVKNEFVSYKSGTTSDSRQITIGDEINYYVKNNQVQYVEAINDSTIYEQIRQAEDSGDKVVAHFASVGLISSRSTVENGKTVDTKVIRMKDFTGNVYEINVKTDPKTGIKNDVIVYKNGKSGGTNLLQENDSVTYYVKDNKNVIYIKVMPAVNKYYSGTLRSVTADPALNTNSLSLYDYNDQILEFPVAQNVLVTINGNYGQLKDLQGGQDLDVTVRDGYITKIVTETNSENPGGIDEYGKMRSGKVSFVFSDSITVRLRDDVSKLFYVDASTAIIKGGVRINIAAIKEGDSVKLYFNDIYSTHVDKIEVEGIERELKNIYKGKISEVNTTTGTLTLELPSYMKNNNWVTTDQYTLEIPYDERTLIYSNANQVRPKDFAKLYKGKTAYVAVENNYGTETAIKVTIPNGGEIISYDSITRVDSIIGSLELYNKENYDLNPGTMVIKDGKLLDMTKLKYMDRTYIIGDYYNGKKTATVVRVITGQENMFDRLYIGAVYLVDYSSVIFKNYARLDNNKWTTVEPNASNRFYFTSDTTIKNVTAVDNPVSITPSKFFDLGYNEEENKDTNGRGLKYERYYGIFVTDGKDMMYALNLRKRGLVATQNIDDEATSVDEIKTKLTEFLNNTRLTRGTVSSVDTKWSRIKLTDSADWSQSLNAWNTNQVDTYVKYVDTLVMKDDKAVAITDIKVGDDIYVLRKDETAMVIFVVSK